MKTFYEFLEEINPQAANQIYGQIGRQGMSAMNQPMPQQSPADDQFGQAEAKFRNCPRFIDAIVGVAKKKFDPSSNTNIVLDFMMKSLVRQVSPATRV